TPGQDGKALFICRAGCDQKAVLGVMQDRGIWPRQERREWNGHAASARPSTAAAPETPPPHPDLGQASQVYPYYTAEGRLLGAVCRWDGSKGKTIRPAALDGSRWRWAGFRKPHPLYRLADLAAHKRMPV